MSVRQTLFAAAVIGLALGAPASGDLGAGAANRVAGTVYVSTQQLPPEIGSGEIVAMCSYLRRTSPDGRWRFELVGETTAYSASSSHTALTVVECWMEAVDGDPVSAHVLVFCGRATCTGRGTAGPWEPQAVKVCLRAWADFRSIGGLETVTRFTGTHCS